MTAVRNQQLVELGDRYLELSMRRNPFAATLLGISGYDDLVPDPSPAATAQLVDGLREIAAAAAALGGESLAPTDEVSRAVLQYQADIDAEQEELRTVEFGTAPFFVAPHAQVLQMMPKAQLSDPGRAADYLARLQAVPGYLDSAGEQLRAGTAKGRTATARSLQRSLTALDGYLASGLSEDVLLSPAPPSWAGRHDWLAQRERVVAEQVRPALVRLRDVYREDLLPRARSDEHVGIGWLPDGEHMYAVLARSHTTTSLSPKELHELGLAELARLDAEFRELSGRVLGAATTEQALTRLREDPGLRLRDADELVATSRAALDRAHDALPKWFGLLPPAGCDLRLVPPIEAPTAAPAYYTPPSADSGRVGTYWVNPHAVSQRPRYDVETIAFHEGIPGHHLQLSIAQQLDHLPAFRRVGTSPAYVEGWGLYSERLADEMGLYSGDLDRFGMLAFDSWRACRLVVDTGLHALGWSLQQAVEFMQTHTPLPLTVIEPEVDRYVGMPGQALSYMIGRLELFRLRRQAQETLGTRFDIREFHDTVLSGGALPLTILAGQVATWLDTR